MRIKLKNIVVYIFDLVFAFGVGLGVLSCILDLVTFFYSKIDSYKYSITLFGGIIFAFIFICYRIITNNIIYRSRFEIWIVNNKAKFILFFFLLFCFLNPLNGQKKISFERFNDFIFLCWTITGISIGIILVWEVLLNHIRKGIPEYSDSFSLLEKIKYIEKKKIFYISASRINNPIIILFLSVVSLVLTSMLVFTYSDYNYINTYQYFVLLTFYLSLYAFFLLFINLYSLITIENKKILKNQKLTKNDLDLENDSIKEISKLCDSFEIIDKNIDISKEQKIELKKEILWQIQGDQQYLMLDVDGNVLSNNGIIIYKIVQL